MYHLKSVITLTVIVMFIGCVIDFIANAVIQNETGESIRVTLYHRKSFVDSLYHDTAFSYKRYLVNSTGTMAVSKYIIDTPTLSVTYTIAPGKDLLVSKLPGGFGVEPTYEELDSVRVYYRANRITVPASQMQQVFRRKDGTWIWAIR